MNRPLREHFEVPTDICVSLRTFDYIEELEKYIDYLEALRQPDVSRRSEQLSCETCIFNIHSWSEDYPCATCCGFDKHQAT